MSNLRVLFLGDVVGEPGRKALSKHLKEIKAREEIDFVYANGENAAGGRGITPKIAIEMLRAGVAVITLGDHVWDQAEIIPHFETEPRLLRPINFPPGTPGRGSVVLDCGDTRVAVLNVQGRTFMHSFAENPFLAAQQETKRLREEENATVILVDFHAEATSEKIAMGWHLDGIASLVAGTHTHVATADERILPNGTAFICDVGMCGPVDSVLGRRWQPIVQRFLTGMPARFPVASGPVALNGVLADIDSLTGRATAIRRFRHEIP